VRFRSRVYIIILLGAITACITTPDEVVIAPIHQALTAGNASEVQKAAANKNQLSALNEYGETPLLYAVKPILLIFFFPKVLIPMPKIQRMERPPLSSQ